MARRTKTQRKKTTADLTDKQVQQIRAQYAKGKTQSELADKHGLRPYQIGRLTRGAARAAAGGPTGINTREKLTPRQVVALRRQYAKGSANQTTLAERYGISNAAVSRVVRGITYAEVGGPRIDKHGLPSGRKLTPKQILHIAQSDTGLSELARKYGISRQAVHAHRQRWSGRTANSAS